MLQSTKVEGIAESPVEPSDDSMPRDTQLDEGAEAFPTQTDSSQIELPPNVRNKGKKTLTARKASSPAGPPAAKAQPKAKEKPEKESVQLPPSVYQRISRAPPEIKKKWKEHFSKLPAADESRNEFIDELMKVKMGQFGTSQFFKSLTEVVRSVGNEKLGRWWTFKEMCDTEGEAQTRSMAQFKTVPMQRNPRLNPKANIPFPEDQEFWKAHVWAKDSTMTNKSQTKESDKMELDEDDADQFDEMVGAVAQMKDSNKKEAEEESKTDVAPIEIEGMREAMTAAKKIHAEWERKKKGITKATSNPPNVAKTPKVASLRGI